MKRRALSGWRCARVWLRPKSVTSRATLSVFRLLSVKNQSGEDLKHTDVFGPGLAFHLKRLLQGESRIRPWNRAASVFVFDSLVVRGRQAVMFFGGLQSVPPDILNITALRAAHSRPFWGRETTVSIVTLD